MQWRRVAVAKIADLPPDRGLTVPLNEERECTLFLHKGRCYAVGSLCPHQNAPLCNGLLEGNDVLVCRRHGFRFSLQTGECLTLGGYGIPTYPVEIEEASGTIFVRFLDDSP
ncbi:MAG TPA: Rieske (2Fe-2S) protein [Chthonomonas sp.]|jgi:nitrite reductase/ring-hydroxylating ferredoxin subunit|uniref:Rieske (2Fe-2S) protein n=1 Tax=Chthonomonas sp. TaxID=2282153 RepID=UPI002B4B4438|nr:Rieske (2Fe-2S) protein [Chthonomonas sp.]HLH79759.1 Rieske (2Fe-2S) protein [Chthonomonas sp.]